MTSTIGSERERASKGWKTVEEVEILVRVRNGVQVVIRQPASQQASDQCLIDYLIAERYMSR